MEKEMEMEVKRQGQKFQQYFCATIASIGALIFGFLIAWTAPCLKFLRSTNYGAPFMVKNKHEAEMIAALMPLGALVGSLPAGFLADSVGRKLTLIIFTVPYVISWLLTTFAANVTVLCVARFVGGMVAGLFLGILPLYINEIAEDSIRGALGTCFYFFVKVGQVQVHILSLFDSYQILCYGCTAFSVVLLIGLPFIPESPTYLVKKNRSKEAETVLHRLRGPHYDISSEMKGINEQLESKKEHTFSVSSIFTKARLRSIIICFGLMVFQQFTGVAAVIFYSNMIFEEAKLSSPVVCAIILSISQSLASFTFGFFVDHTARKTLLLTSMISMGLSLLVLGSYFWMLDCKMDTRNLTWIPLTSIVVFIVAFNMGIGPVPWLISVELFDPEVKSFGTTLTAATNLAGVTLVTFFFATLIDLISAAYTFWMFAGVCTLGTLFILIVVPETKGKSVQEMQLIMAE